MLKLMLRHGRPLVISPDVEELTLDAPLVMYHDLPLAFRELTKLRRLKIMVHFERHQSHWPYGKLDPYPDLDFLGDVQTLEELEVFFLHRLRDGRVLRDLPRLRRVVVGFKTRFDLAWLNSLNIEDLSVGLTSMVYGHERLASMLALTALGVDNVKGDDLKFLRNLTRLELLGIGGSVESLSGIGGASSLSVLHMNTLRFHSYGDIDGLHHLSKLKVQSSYDFRSLSELDVSELRELIIYGSKSKIQNLDSIKPLRRSTRLEKFIFGGDICDDDITPLLELPALQDCLINPKYKPAVTSQLADSPRLKVFRF